MSSCVGWGERYWCECRSGVSDGLGARRRGLMPGNGCWLVGGAPLKTLSVHANTRRWESPGEVPRPNNAPPLPNQGTRVRLSPAAKSPSPHTASEADYAPLSTGCWFPPPRQLLPNHPRVTRTDCSGGVLLPRVSSSPTPPCCPLPAFSRQPRLLGWPCAGSR